MEKCVKTVGELKEFLEKLDPNMGLDLIANCYKGRNFCTIKKNIYLDRVKENGIVLDPFMGSGTTAKMALLNNRKYVGFEISKEYCELANKRLNTIDNYQNM